MKTRLLAFIGTLRDAGLSITVAETLDALRAVSVIGVERGRFREALAAAIVKDEAERSDFDAVFDRFFAVRGRRRGKGQHPQPGEDGNGQGRPKPGSLHRRTEPAEPAARVIEPRRPPERSERPSDRHRPQDGRKLTRRRVLQTMPFHELSPHHIEDCTALVEELAQRFRAHLARRLRAGRHGRLDVRRTLRRSLSTGGVPLDPVFRQRRPGRPDLLALCDFSYSVVTASNFLVALLAPAQEVFRRVRVFAFVDRPVEISVEAGRVVPHEKLDLHARSDFGKVLVDFWGTYEPALTRNTILLILGDARNNRRPPRADLLGRMRSMVRQVVWLNPDAVDRWNTGDSVMRAYEPYCDTVFAASNIRELYRTLKRALGA